MTIKLSFCFSIVCALTLSGCSSPETRTVKIADEVNKEVSQPLFSEKKYDFVPGKLKDEDFSEKRLRKYSLKTLDLVYDVAETLSFYFAENMEYLSWQQNAFTEKVRRNDYTDYNIARMFWTYVNIRMFDKAADIRKQFPKTAYAIIPEEIVISTGSDTARWPVYDIFEGGKRGELKELHLETGPKIIMSMSPGCPVTERAMTEILADPEWAALFRKYGVLLTVKFDIDGVLRWREKFGFQDIYIAYKQSRIPEFNFTVSPYFYFMKDGKVLFSFRSWGKSSSPKFLTGLKAIGVSPEPVTSAKAN